MKTEVVENFPEYMVFYAVYGKSGYGEYGVDDVTDEDIKLYEEWRDRNGYGTCYGTGDAYAEASFSSHPAFGLPCNVIPVVFEVEKGIQSSYHIKSGRDNFDKLKEFERRLGKVIGNPNEEEDLIQYYAGRYDIPEETLDEIADRARIHSSRKISSSQKGFENVAEGTKYDDYHIDTNGMGILSVENIIEEIEGRGNQAVLTVQTSSGSTNHSQFGSKDWKEYKDSVNNAGNAITDVWVTEVEGGSYVRNSRRPVKSGYDILNVGNKTPAGNLVFYLVNDGKRMPIMTEDYAIREGGYDKDYLYEGSKNGEFVRFNGFSSIINRLAKGCGLGEEEIEQIEYSITGNKVDFTVYPTERGIHLLNNGWWDDYSVKWELSAEEQIPLYGADEKVAMSVELTILGLSNDLTSSRKITSGRILEDVKAEALQKVKEYGGKRINDNPIEILEILDDGEYSAFLVFTFKSGNDVYKMVYDYGFGGKKDKPSIKKIESFRRISSARYIATDPETGEVLGSADTYEEAVNEWGEDVTITDSEVGDGTDTTQGGILSSWDNDTPRGEGWLAHDDGKQKDECPYEIGTVEYEDWIDGWEAAYQEVNGMGIGSSRQIKSAKPGIGGGTVFETEVLMPKTEFNKWKRAVEREGVAYTVEYDFGGIGCYVIRNGLPKHIGTWFPDTEVLACDDISLFGNYIDNSRRISSSRQIKSGRGWNLGYNAYYNGKSQTDCPSDLSEEDTFEWMDGWDYAEDEDRNDEDEIESSKEDKVESNYQFNQRIVNSVLTKEITEDDAIKQIASRNNMNIGFAKRILSNLLEDKSLIQSGVMEMADDINKDFDLNGDLYSWFDDYVEDDGKSTTVGGELVRAAHRIIEQFENDGDKIGIGYGKKTVNPAARYILAICNDYIDRNDIEEMLYNESRINYSDKEYDAWLQQFERTFEDYLRNHEELFHAPNKNDMWDYKEDDDVDSSVTECCIYDDNGNEYWFQKDDDGWKCTSIEYTSDPKYEVDNYVDDLDDIPDTSGDFCDFELDGFEYSAERASNGEDWIITNVSIDNGLADVNDIWETEDFEGYGIFDANGREINVSDLYSYINKGKGE